MIAVLFVIAAVLANAVPGLRFSAGPFSVSLGDGNRVAFQAALATLFAVVARPEFRRKRLASTAAVVAVLVTATADSSPLCGGS